MARAKSERTRSKTAAIDELTLGIEQLQDLIPKVEDLGREGFPYLDGARTRTELQLRECIKRAFGEKSQEFQNHRHHKLQVGSATENKKTVALIKTLIRSLEDKKLELQGTKPTAAPETEPAAPPTSPARPRMTLVPPTEPTTQASAPSPEITTLSSSQVSPPATTPAASVRPATPKTAKETTVAAPPKPVATQSTEINPSAPKQLPASTDPLSLQRHLESAYSSGSSAERTSPEGVISAPPPSQTEEPTLQTMPSSCISQETTPPNPSERQEPPLSLPPNPAQPAAGQFMGETDSVHIEQDPLELCRKLCTRFHAIARQLRLRGEYRSTLAVEDDIDAQDLLHVLLRLQFDDIGADEWMPGYTDGQTRTAFFLNHDRLAIIVKKTRPGLSIKDLAEQVRIDGERYREHGHCADLLCFIYDPEGRIGNPRGLENDLTSVSDHFSITVLVSPK
ncbi:PD-(D/E)XK nuclease domain-containing protein [Petrachloros mirabilis]